MATISPPSLPPAADRGVVNVVREGIVSGAEYASLIVGSLVVAGVLVLINRSCRSRGLPRALRMQWWLVLDVGFGILDLGLKLSFFIELLSNGPFGLVVACACVYAAQVLLNAMVELRLLAAHRREFKRAKHEADKLLGIADMRRRRLIWVPIIFLSILSPTIVVAWPWRSRSFNGYPRMREAGLVMALVLADDLPQIMLVALSLSFGTGGAGVESATAGAVPTSCDAASLAAGISSTQLGSLAVAIISLLWRGVSRLVLTLLGENRTTSHILASRPNWSFAMPAVHLLSDSTDCDELIKYMRSLAHNGSRLTHESRELEFALGFDFDASPSAESQKQQLREVRAYELLESLCEELELEQQGMQSPPYAVATPSLGERRRGASHVPEDAAFFTFIYPLTPWSRRTRESQRHSGGSGEGGGGAPGASAGARAEKIDRFLNEPAPLHADLDDDGDDEAAAEVQRERRRRYAWGCFFLLGGFAYYDASGNLLRIIAFSSGRVDVDTVPLTLEGPFEARGAATRALWDTRRMNKVSLPALLLESAHTFSWVGPGSAEEEDGRVERFRELCQAEAAPSKRRGSGSGGGGGGCGGDGAHGDGGDGGAATPEATQAAASKAAAGAPYPSIDEEPGPQSVVPGELIEDGLGEWHPLSFDESWEFGAFVFSGGDPNCVRDTGPRDIFFRIAVAVPWRRRVGSLLTKSSLATHASSTLRVLTTPRRRLAEAGATGRGSGGASPAELPLSSYASSGAPRPSSAARSSPFRLSLPALRAMLSKEAPPSVAHGQVGMVDDGGSLREGSTDLRSSNHATSSLEDRSELRFFWFDDDDDGDGARGHPHHTSKSWKRCDEASNKAVRAMVDERRHGAFWSSSGWQYAARLSVADGTLIQRNESSGRQRRLVLRFEFASGEACGAAVDERLTRAVVLGEAGPAGAPLLQAGGEADGGTGPGQLVWPLGRKRSEERRALALARKEERWAAMRTAAGGDGEQQLLQRQSGAEVEVVLPSPRWWTPNASPLASPRNSTSGAGAGRTSGLARQQQGQQQQQSSQPQQPAAPSLLRRLMRAITHRSSTASIPALVAVTSFGSSSPSHGIDLESSMAPAAASAPHVAHEEAAATQ